MILIKDKVAAQTYGQAWQAAQLPVINVARFYDALAVLIAEAMTDEQDQQSLNCKTGLLLTFGRNSLYFCR